MLTAKPSSSICMVMLLSTCLTWLSFILLAKLCDFLLISNLVHLFSLYFKVDMSLSTLLFTFSIAIFYIKSLRSVG